MSNLIRRQKMTVYYVPIRDWNCQKNSHPPPNPQVYYVPIRDWNFPYGQNEVRVKKSLLRSYKGLKLGRTKQAFLSSFAVYYVPIRDWNLPLSEVQEEVQEEVFNRLLRSYKGLKPENFKISTKISKKRVYYVPIRDWNNAWVFYIVAVGFGLLRSYKGLKLPFKELYLSHFLFITFL